MIDATGPKISSFAIAILGSTDADARAVSAVTGAVVNDKPVCLQATGFILDSDGRIVTAVYSTRAIGRLMPDDVLGFIRHLKSSTKS
jgi:hypothetical protein